MPMQTDDALYDRFLAGDNAAYDALMLHYGDSIVVYIHGYLHNWQDAEDLMIEAFARIMFKRPRIRQGGFKAYLYKTTRNLAARFHASASRTEHIGLDELPEEAADTVTLEETMIGTERRRILHRCLERIDGKYREVLWLIYFEEMSYAEADAVMGVTVKRIDKLLQTGKVKLRAELEQEGITSATNEERIDRMHQRAEQLQTEQRRRMTRLSRMAAAAACIAVIAVVGAVMPQWSDLVLMSSNESMRASIFSDSAALSYIIIGLLGFSLGIVFTAFCFRLKKWQVNKKTDKQEELHDRDD